MDFQAYSDNIQNLLTSSRSYKIPRFQREFSWDDNNYKDLFEDMISQISFNKENLNFQTSQYFLGNMLFLGQKDDDLVQVIDGQQRLTSITILLAAIRNSLYLASEEDIFNTKQKESARSFAETIQKEYIVKEIDGDIKRKIETTTSYPYFTQTIQENYLTRNSSVKANTEEEEQIERAFTFFQKQLESKSILKKISNRIEEPLEKTAYIDILKALRDQLLKSEIICVFVSDRKQANRIFENINSRGKPLSQVDLIKNHLYSAITLTDAGVDEISIQWSNIKSKLLGVDTSFNEFFLHYWKAVYPSDSPNSNNLYLKFSNRFKNNDKNELQQFIDSLSIGLDFYIQIISPNADDFKQKEKKAEFEYLQSINRFNAIQIRPALLMFYLLENKKNIKIKNTDKIAFLALISHFHFAAFGTSLKIRSNKSTSPYKNFCIACNKANNINDVKKAMATLTDSLKKQITEEQFINAFSMLIFEKKNSRNSLDSYPASYAMKEIAKLFDKRNFENSDYSIEHILDETDDPLTKNIGNLLVLEVALNKEAGEIKIKSKTDLIPYTYKIPSYQKSTYEIVKNLLSSYPDSFNGQNIKDRAKNLGTLFWNNFLK